MSTKRRRVLVGTSTEADAMFGKPEYVNISSLRKQKKEVAARLSQESDYHDALTLAEKQIASLAQPTITVIPDPVNHPAHYGGDSVYEVIKVIEAWKLNFHLGNTVKYIARADHKGTPIQDLKKARWYLDREITNRENAQ